MASESTGGARGGAELRRAISRSRRRLVQEEDRGSGEELLGYL
jgi:hypothetical protein